MCKPIAYFLCTLIMFVVMPVCIKVSIAQETRTCSSDAAATAGCRQFIWGFIEGALITDAAIIANLDYQPSEFKQRALKTRLSERRSGQSQQPATALAGFCLPEKRSLDSIVEETLEHVSDASTDPKLLAKRVYISLKKDYQCNH